MVSFSSFPAVGKAADGPDGDFFRELRRGEDPISVALHVSSVELSPTGSGVRDGQLERELRSEERSTGELARELEEVVFVDLERDERRVDSGRESCSGGIVGFIGLISSSITSTTWPLGATTS
jgi:hypothetical protein